MSNDAKVVRGQLRQLVSEMVPGMVDDAMKEKLVGKVMEEVDFRLRVIEKNIKETLESIDQRSKDTLGYLVRQVTEAGVQPIPAPQQAEQPAAEASEQA